MKNRILCCIFNHNENADASAWADRLSPHFDTLILDSGSTPACQHPLSVTLENIYYSGLMNEAWRRGSEGGYKWVMILTSDLQISPGNCERLIAGMKEVAPALNVGLYQPSAAWRGRALPQSRCHFSGKMRPANFQEGWFHLIRLDLLGKVCPIDTGLNHFGWGIDLALSHFARIMKLLILVDDRVRVVHPGGTGYNKGKALEQMRAWHATLPGYTSPRHFKPLREPVREELVVSLTTWKPRMGNLPAVLDSIFRQTLPPDAVVLNLAFEEVIPPDVQAYLDSRGVKIQRVPDTRVYKKFLPTLEAFPDACIVAIDDDWIYPEGMLEDFMAAHRKHPGRPVSGNRVHFSGTDFHCGCASLVRREFFGELLPLIDAEMMQHCPSDDVVYTFLQKMNDRLYAHTRHLYYDNLTPYNDTAPYSGADTQAPKTTWNYLCERFGASPLGKPWMKPRK